jgi:penicillin V acylase-like amidase (Ntn superfamily)
MKLSCDITPLLFSYRACGSGVFIFKREEVMMNVITLLIVALLFIVPKIGYPCSTFCLDKGEHLVFGKNLDWIQDNGFVFINKRGVLKTAMLAWNVDNLATWTSKYGSITFNQIGCDWPFGGVNEAGLVVEMLAVDRAKYPVPDERPIINGLQWIQYQLDNFSRVEQVIASDSQLRILSIKNPPPGSLMAHFLVCDKTGNCASIEFINGKLVYHTKETMPVKVLTNSTYTDSMEFLHDDQKGNLGNFSLFRFVKAVEMLKTYKPKVSPSAVDYSFDILSNIKPNGGVYMLEEPIYTQWSIVYDIKNLKVYFHTRGNEQIRYFALSSFDFSCKTPIKVLDMQADLSGDVTKKFIDYTQQINLKLLGNTPLLNLPEDVLDKLSKYPETTICTNK